MAQTVQVEHLQENCRTCLDNLNGCKNKRRYYVQQLPRAIFRIFKQITGFKRMEKSLYPKWICGVCYDKIKNFDEFQVETKENKRFLENIVESYKAKNLVNNVDIKNQELEEENSIQKFEDTQLISNQNTLEGTQSCDNSKDESVFENIFLQIEMKEEIDDIEPCTTKLTDTLSLTNPQAANIKTESSIDKRVNEEITCKICNLKYSTAALLKIHLRVHKELRAFQCKFCDSSFNKKSNFNQHIKEAHAETRMEIDCKFGCGKTCTPSKSVAAHYKNKHNIDEVDQNKKLVNDNNEFGISIGIGAQDDMTDDSSDDNFDLLFVSKTTCKICQKTYSSPSALKLHMRLHEEKRPFQCDQCERGFNKKNRLKEHIQETHAEKALEIVCKFGCGKSFLRFQTAAAHYRNKHPPKIDCQKGVKNDLIEISGTQSQAETDTKTGRDNLTVLKKFTCKVCLQNYSSASTLRVHMRLHREKRPFQCDQCERNFNKRARLNRHIEECHSNNPIEIICKFGCGKVFRRQETATNHYYLKHKLPERGITPQKNSYVCEDCGRVLKSLASLREHSFTHRPAEDRPYKCEQCGKSFVTKRTYEDHLLRHTGIKNFECSYCGIKKTTRRELRAHVNTHINEKTYTCSICAKVFNRVENLRLHERVVHQGIRRYKCSYCDQAFGKPDTLKHHVMRHTGEKPHKCQICGRCFIQAVAL